MGGGGTSTRDVTAFSAGDRGRAVEEEEEEVAVERGRFVAARVFAERVGDGVAERWPVEETGLAGMEERPERLESDILLPTVRSPFW